MKYGNTNKNQCRYERGKDTQIETVIIAFETNFDN